MNESKRLLEVWDWKEDVFNKTEGLNSKERVAFFNIALAEFRKKVGVPLRFVKTTVSADEEAPEKRRITG